MHCSRLTFVSAINPSGMHYETNSGSNTFIPNQSIQSARALSPAAWHRPRGDLRPRAPVLHAPALRVLPRRLPAPQGQQCDYYCDCDCDCYNNNNNNNNNYYYYFPFVVVVVVVVVVGCFLRSVARAPQREQRHRRNMGAPHASSIAAFLLLSPLAASGQWQQQRQQRQ